MNKLINWLQKREGPIDEEEEKNDVESPEMKQDYNNVNEVTEMEL